jgi:hypothetical protein
MVKSPPPPSKRELMQTLIAAEDVYLQLDPRHDDVVLPERLRLQPLLVLRFGLEMPVPIPDLEIGEAGVTATLSFDQAPFRCSLPWGAVFGLLTESGQGFLWAADAPPEVLARLARIARGQPRPEPDEPLEAPASPRSPRRRLVAVDGGLCATSRPAEGGPLAPTPPATPRPILHVVR